MTKISAAEVNKLRKTTGAGMMDCKKALQENDGDFDKAIEYLRKKGQKVANKRADKEASEGCIISKTNDDNSFGVIINLNCETDFVAKNDEFVQFATDIADVALKSNPSDLEDLKTKEMSNGRTIADNVTDMTGKIGEKIELSQFDKIEDETVIAYIHHGNKIATLVGLNKKADGVVEAGKNVAMQVAAMSPVAVNEDSVPKDVIEREHKIGREQAIEEGKPEQILDKIADGKVKKFLKENTLVNQAYIKDNKTSVQEYLKSIDKELTVNTFHRFALGE